MNGLTVSTSAFMPTAVPTTKPIERSIGLKKLPKSGEVMLLCTSRSADAPNTL